MVVSLYTANITVGKILTIHSYKVCLLSDFYQTHIRQPKVTYNRLAQITALLIDPT